MPWRLHGWSSSRAYLAAERSTWAKLNTDEQLEVVPAIPRNATGKVLKHVLRDEFKG